MKKGNVVLGTFAGLAAGAIAGILFAPKKGTLIRKQIVDKSDGYILKLKSKANEFSETLTEKFKRTKKHAEELADKEKTKHAEIQKDVKSATENLKNDIASDMRHFS